MEILNENSTFIEIKNLLDDATTRDQTLRQLQTLSSEDDAVKGLIDFLKINDWNYDSVLKSEVNAAAAFPKILQQVRSKNKARYMAAAVLIPLIGVSALLYFTLSAPSETDRLYSKYAETEIGLPTLMSNNSKKSFDEAMAAFKDEDYEEAKEGFEKLKLESPLNDTLEYFIACSEMELGNFTKAVSHFNKVDATSVFREKADFRMALSLSQNKELEKAKSLLEKMAGNENHAYHSVAIEMLEEMVRFRGS